MELSSDVLIDFGLNQAGYLVAALLIYVLLGNRGRRQNRAACAGAEGTAAPNPKTPHRIPLSSSAEKKEPEFISLAASRGGSDRRESAKSEVENDEKQTQSHSAPDRRHNRRVIYREAMRLLASGTSRGDVLDQLPLTEGELEMLSVAGKA